MTTRAQYLIDIATLVKGDAALDDTDKGLALDLALTQYAKDRPRQVVEDVAGAGGFDFAVSGLAAWADGFSAVKSVEYPVDDDDPAADMVDAGDWAIYAKPDGDCLRLLADKPAVGETLRVTYTALHTVSATVETVKTNDVKAVQALAAALCCDLLAALYATDQDSTIDADSVGGGTRAGEYAKRAAKYRRLYNMHFGRTDGKPAAAGATLDWDVNYPDGMDRLTHPRRQR